MGDWFNISDGVRLARMIERAPGSKPMQDYAEAFRAVEEMLNDLADRIDSYVAQLRGTWDGLAAQQAEAAYRRYTAGLRDTATIANKTATQADAQAESNDLAKQLMPAVQQFLSVWAAYLAAKASKNYPTMAAMLALYTSLSQLASSIMSNYNSSTDSNVGTISTPEQTPEIAESSSGLDGIQQLLDAIREQQEQAEAFDRETETDYPESMSTTLDGLNGGAGSGVPIGMTVGGLGAMPGLAAGVITPSGWGPGRGFGAPVVPAGAPVAGRGTPMGAMPPPRRRDNRSQGRKVLAGNEETIIAPDRHGAAPRLDLAPGVGVVEYADPDSDRG